MKERHPRTFALRCLLATSLIAVSTAATAVIPQQSAETDIVASARSYREANEHRILLMLLPTCRTFA